MQVLRTDDFTVDAKGITSAWSKTVWQALSPRGGAERARPTLLKMLYSPTGPCALTDGDDRTLTATMNADFLPSWTEDVFEFFLQTDERYPVYFEYEISPLGFGLFIIIPNCDNQCLG